MSWFTGDDGRRYELFGSGGGQELADELGVPLLAQLPLVPALREGGDVGRPITAVDPESEAAQTFLRMAERVAVELAAQGLQPPAADQLTSVGCRLPPPLHRLVGAPSWMSASASPRSHGSCSSSWPTTSTATTLKGAVERGPGRRHGHPVAHRPPGPGGPGAGGEDRVRRGRRGRRRAPDGLRDLTAAVGAAPTDLIDHRLLFVTGKGGVGKTTIAAALAIHAARPRAAGAGLRGGRQGDAGRGLRGRPAALRTAARSTTGIRRWP